MSSPKIKIFLDGADRPAILEMAKNPLVSGFTTNPSLMKKAGVKDYKAYCQEILTQIGGKPISFEVFADDLPTMKRQGKEIATWGKNVYVKIPISNSTGESTIPLIREMSQGGVQINITAILTLTQVWETCQAVKGGAPAIVSVFAGRIADTGRDPMPTMTASAELCRETGPKVECLWASTREAYNVVQAEASGSHIITAPADVIKKVTGFGKDLKSVSLDTVKTFKADSEAAGFSL
ncbi:transaldolase [bacterium]|jgi:transaldolase|nr:transaldolase [bacterium]